MFINSKASLRVLFALLCVKTHKKAKLFCASPRNSSTIASSICLENPLQILFSHFRNTASDFAGITSIIIKPRIPAHPAKKEFKAAGAVFSMRVIHNK